MSRLKSFFVELQQRRVFRIASVYAVTMWIVVQGALDLFPVFGIPDWAARLLVVVAVLGTELGMPEPAHGDKGGEGPFEERER